MESHAMVEATQTHESLPQQPALIVVTGQPGSGKTSLAHSLSQAVRCPAICRDEIKEGFLNTTVGTEESSNDIAWKVYEAFFDTVQVLINHRITLIAEAAFQHKVWMPKLEPMRELARIRIIVCTIDPELARTRRINRHLSDPVREQFHPDDMVQAVREGRHLPINGYDPPHMDVPTLTVDTSDGYRPDFKTIVAFARA